jgi:hypothetical protein
MRWRAAFIWISVAALVAAIFAQFLGPPGLGWVVPRNLILIAWAVLVVLVAMTRGMRWTSVLVLLSAVPMLGIIISSHTYSLLMTDVRDGLLLAWAILLLPVTVALASHPMRAPAWGVFIGFAGILAAAALIVLQVLPIANVLSGNALSQATAVPLAVIGIWIVVASGLGFGAEGFPRWVDALGLLAGIGLLASSISTLTASSFALVSAAGQFAVVAYVLWAIGLAWVLWGTQHVSHRFRGLASGHAV